ncbi:MAG: amino acid adenylation domain-containing protein [bacterium]|nr:amino acid adenylation domain-containing protein [bacterium]
MNETEETKKRTVAAGQNVEERDYWLGKLAGELVKTTFPYDHRKGGEGGAAAFSFQLTGEVFAGLVKISNKSNPRLHILLTAGWLMLLNKYTGSGDIIVGVPTYKQEVDGELINTILALRNTVNGEMTVKELLMQVGKTILEADKNQNYPIDTLVYKLDLPEGSEGFPLFDLSVLLEEIHDKGYLERINQNLIVSFRQTDTALEGEIEYNPGLYRESTIRRITEHYRQLMGSALSNVNAPISQVSILCDEERKKVFEEFNDNAADFYRDKSIYRLVEEHAASSPESVALSFEGKDYTYSEVNAAANRLVRVLIDKGVVADNTVGILMERSPFMAINILAIWKAGGAYIPMDVKYPPQRVLGILGDSGTRVLLAIPGVVDAKVRQDYDGFIFDPFEVVGGESGDDPGNPGVDVSMDSLAYVIYTSGSTGKPKGAMVEHIGMMNHMQSKINLLGIDNKSIVAQNASHTFDISVWQFFVALAAGGRTVIYPETMVLDPVSFLDRIIEDKLTILEVVPSYLSVMLDAVESRRPDAEPPPGVTGTPPGVTGTPPGVAGYLPLPIDYLLVTGEEVKPHLVTRWFEMYPGIPVVNAYGPTEASDDITHHVMDKAEDSERVPIGKTVQNLNIYIVDKYNNLCPVGVGGELWVSGVGVGRGYLKDEERTKQVFIDDPFAAEPGVRLYKTGDLARWLPDGSIDFLGRIDYQVKIRGFRIELGEIENALVAHPQLKEAVVIDREDKEGKKYLCAYLVNKTPDTQPPVTQLKEFLLKTLPDYMVPAHFITLPNIPLTPNGKIDRKALPEPDTKIRSIPLITEEKLKLLETSATGRKPGAAGAQVEAHPERIIDAAAAALEEHAKLEAFSKQNDKHFYPLSHSQKLFYYIEKTYVETSCNNNLYTVKYNRTLDPALLEQAINKTLLKNPGLRLRVAEVDLNGTITASQYVAPYEPYILDSFDFSGEPVTPAGEEISDGFTKWARENADKPFKLIDSDLFYFANIKFSAETTGYCIKLHHLLSDGWTFLLLFNEIDRIYRQLEQGEPVDESPNPSYLDYLADEKTYLTSPQLKKDREYWHKNMLPLPPEADISSNKGDQFRIETRASKLQLPAELRENMHQYCGTASTSIFKLVLSALSVYVSRVTGVGDLVLGSVNHGRSGESHKQMTGLFIGFFPIRIKIEDTLPFEEFVDNNGKQINHTVKNHSRYPYDILNTELRDSTGVDTRYLANVNLIFHPTREEGDFSVEHHTSDYDPNPLTIHINAGNKEKDGIMELEWEYQIDRFSADEIAALHLHLVNILDDAMANPKRPVGELQMLSKEEKGRILNEFNDSKASYPEDKTLYQIFQEQAEKTPRNIAVTGVSLSSAPGTGTDESITYRDLNEKANRLARELQKRGVTTNTIVGIMADRSIETIVAIQAVIKAGGAYMAISLTYPDKRIDFMCEDTCLHLILTDNKRPLPGKEALLMDIAATKENGDCTDLPLNNEPGDAAGIFYTSGSTGTPKGVVVQHRGLVNRLTWHQRLFPIGDNDVVLHKTTAIFDVSMWELFWWTFSGASIYLLPTGQGDDPGDITDAVKKGGVTALHFVPTPLSPFLKHIEATGNAADLTSLKYVFASGEVLPPTLVPIFKELLYDSNGTRLFNLYGPTEASIDVSYYDCQKEWTGERVPIGKPVDNVNLYIVDNNMELLPVGVPGQLVIAGPALATGYLNRPELTAEIFRPTQNKWLPVPQSPISNNQSPITNLYQTGDLARWLPDGNIDFLGRIDKQVQIYGIRIEVGEIESILLQHNDIQEAVVVPRLNDNNETSLCAFLLAANDLEKSDFKEIIKNELPNYMVPSQYIELEKLPLTGSGKVNRRLLELIDLEPQSQSAEFVAPNTEMESQIANIWKEVLNIDKIGVNDNFFDIGGNSLAIIQVNIKLKDTFNRDVPALIMFEYPTISSLINYLDKENSPAQEPIEKDRTETKAKGKSKMQQRRNKAKKARR